MNSKNMTLELLKLLAAYMVVFIHVPFSGNLDIVMDALARFAVPFFFLVSGFFSCDLPLSKIRKRMKHILVLILISVVSYTLFQVVIRMSATDIAAYFQQYLTFKTIIRFFVFNGSVCSGHLWYLYAILYVYAILYLTILLKIDKKIVYVISFSLLGLNLLLGEGLSIFGIAIPTMLIRNFALTGVPFFALGMFAKENENKLRDIPNYISVIFAAIGILETVFSRYFWGSKEFYLGSLFILFAIVILFIKNQNVQYPKFFVYVAGCSTYIYIFHIMLSTFMKKLYDICFMNGTPAVLEIIHPILVCVISTVFAFLLVQIQKYIHKTRTQTNHNA